MPIPEISFEVFPPASIPASFKLWACLERLQAFAPRFVSVTYGAQGSVQERTQDTALAVHDQTGLSVAAHLTAARASRAEVMARAHGFARAGITDIVALRGDPETSGAAFVAHPEGFTSSLDLIETLAQETSFTIRVGAYPESHPDAASSQQNIDFLKAKFDAGAQEAITQFFFEAETFLRFRDACAAAGISQPITPGILPITDWARTKRFAQRCGASVPTTLDRAFTAARTQERHDLLALCTATEMCDTLVSEGVDKLHFYTLNRAELTEDVLQALGLRPAAPALRKVA